MRLICCSWAIFANYVPDPCSDIRLVEQRSFHLCINVKDNSDLQHVDAEQFGEIALVRSLKTKLKS